MSGLTLTFRLRNQPQVFHLIIYKVNSVCGRIRTSGTLMYTFLAGKHHRPLGHTNIFFLLRVNSYTFFSNPSQLHINPRLSLYFLTSSVLYHFSVLVSILILKLFDFIFRLTGQGFAPCMWMIRSDPQICFYCCDNETLFLYVYLFHHQINLFSGISVPCNTSTILLYLKPFTDSNRIFLPNLGERDGIEPS